MIDPIEKGSVDLCFVFAYCRFWYDHFYGYGKQTAQGPHVWTRKYVNFKILCNSQYCTSGETHPKILSKIMIP